MLHLCVLLKWKRDKTKLINKLKKKMFDKMINENNKMKKINILLKKNK
jgi:hypothetical protein